MENGSAVAGIRVADPLRRKRKMTVMTRARAIEVTWTSWKDSDCLRAVPANRELDGRRQLSLKPGSSFDGVVDLDDIAVRLAHHHQIDSTTSSLRRVKPRARLVVLDAVDNIGYFLETDSRAVAIGHNHRTISSSAVELAARLNVEGLLGTIKGPSREVGVPILQCLLNLVDPNLVAVSRVGSTCTRTAYLAPKTFTWATPFTIERRWAMRLSAKSFNCHIGKVEVVSPGT